MYFQQIIKYVFLFLVLISSEVSICQSFQTKKYNSEYNPYFHFKKFKRGEKSKVLSSELDVLEKKNKEDWTFTDSVKFSEISLLTHNYSLAHHYLNELSKNALFSKNQTVQELHLISHIVLRENSDNTDCFKHYSSRNKSFVKIINAYNTYFTTDIVPDNILDLYLDSLQQYRKGSASFNSKIIKPLKTSVAKLYLLVNYIHKDDPIIAKSFNEIGEVLEQSVSLNQAFIAYSIARIYNKNNEDILNNVKRIKAKHILKNYNTPNFRKYFPRIEDWRFDYEILKEKIIFEKNDTIPKLKPSLVGTDDKIKLPFQNEIIIPVGLFLIFLLILIFTKTKK